MIVEPPIAQSAGDAHVVRRQPYFALGMALIASVALELVGSFVRYATVPAPPGSTTYSYSLYEGLRWGRPVFFAGLALTLALGWAIAFRASREWAALAAGFVALATVGVPYGMFIWLESRGWSLGAGFYIVLVRSGLVAVVTVCALVFLSSSAPSVVRPPRSVRVLAVVGAVAAGGAATLRDVRWPLEPLALLGPLRTGSVIASVVALLAVVALPLVALRIRGRVGANVVLGLAVSEALNVVNALFHRYGDPRSLPLAAHLTVGWWLELLAAVLLATAAWQMRRADTDFPELDFALEPQVWVD